MCVNLLNFVTLNLSVRKRYIRYINNGVIIVIITIELKKLGIIELAPLHRSPLQKHKYTFL